METEWTLALLPNEAPWWLVISDDSGGLRDS